MVRGQNRTEFVAAFVLSGWISLCQSLLHNLTVFISLILVSKRFVPDYLGSSSYHTSPTWMSSVMCYCKVCFQLTLAKQLSSHNELRLVARGILTHLTSVAITTLSMSTRSPVTKLNLFIIVVYLLWVSLFLFFYLTKCIFNIMIN